MVTTELGNGSQALEPKAIQKCKRCKEIEALVIVRQESLCSECFDKYVRSKYIKRMESFRVRYAPNDTGVIVPTQTTLLVPLSFGVSSIALLNLISNQLKAQRQRSNGQTGYNCLVIHVDESCVDPSVPSQESINAVQERFSDIGTFRALSVEDIYDFRNVAREIELDHGLDEEKGGSDAFDKKEALMHLLSSLSSTTSRMDILSILRTRLIVEVAKKEGCAAVLWGDSTTRLAQKTLAETAKGRGFSIPWQTSDGDSPFGIEFRYPVRDLLKSELVNYVSIPLPTSPKPLLPLCVAYSSDAKHTVANAASGRNITIDELMIQYFNGIETQYPSIVANVVSTAGKLKPLRRPAGINISCKICGLPGDGAGGDITLSALTLNAVDSVDAKSSMCYGCARSMHGSGVYDWPLEP
ncbi:hypothetical protein DFP73DRAFT_555007 [Morchella snyderi]|nr:hypothetical protein DFP73DRAFT_555007 [Morchella snyderi]